MAWLPAKHRKSQRRTGTPCRKLPLVHRNLLKISPLTYGSLLKALSGNDGTTSHTSVGIYTPQTLGGWSPACPPAWPPGPRSRQSQPCLPAHADSGLARRRIRHTRFPSASANISVKQSASRLPHLTKARRRLRAMENTCEPLLQVLPLPRNNPRRATKAQLPGCWFGASLCRYPENHRNDRSHKSLELHALRLSATAVQG